MMTKTISAADMRKPLNLLNKDFIDNKFAYYKWLRENDPVHKGKLAVLNIYLLSQYNDCVDVLKDPRIVRNRTTATGGGRFPVPLPKAVNMMVNSMINEDDPAHRRLRMLVHKAFTPSRLAYLDERLETLTHELLDRAEKKGTVDLINDYALPIPVTIISEMVGVSPDETPQFASYMEALSTGLSGFTIAKTMFFDLPKAVTFCRELIQRKKADPQDDILTALIEAEEEGEKLSEDELIAMVFLLIVAGYETTVHLITNAVQTLLTHPDQLDRLRAEPALLDSAVEEILRFNGPIQGTKMGYAMEDITINGVTIPKGKPMMPLLGSANRDPAVFENPDVFDIGRTPNRHLGFGQGIHYCLGAPLARMETKVALKNLFDRNPNLRLAVAPEELQIQRIPAWHRHVSLPVTFG